jgi:predicted type IV restriction endonuclease
MKDAKRIERLYAGLTAKESATLVFTNLSQGNVAEADRIRDLVPIKCYRMPDADHTDWFERLRRLTLYYAMERWRYQAHAFAATAIMLHAYHSDKAEDEERGQICFEAWQHWETHLLSLDGALDTVCSKHHIDVAVVRRLASTDGPYQVLGLGQVDPQLLAEMTQAFDNLLQDNG